MASRTAARPGDATPQIAVHELEERLVRGAINVLGVRQPAEWHAGHIPGASYVTGAELPDPLGGARGPLPGTTPGTPSSSEQGQRSHA